MIREDATGEGVTGEDVMWEDTMIGEQSAGLNLPCCIFASTRVQPLRS